MIKGISQNYSPEGLPEGFAFFTKNQVINQKLNEVFNEKGTRVIDSFIAAGIDVINGVITSAEKIIIFCTGQLGGADISYTDALNKYTKVVVPQIGSGGLISWTLVADNLIPTLGQAYYDGTNGTSFTSDKLQITKSFPVGVQVQGEIIFSFPAASLAFHLSFNNSNISGYDIAPLGTDPDTGYAIRKLTYTFVTSTPLNSVGFYINGTAAQTGRFKLYSHTLSASQSQANLNGIGVYDEATSSFDFKVKRADLGFDPAFPITGVAKLNSIGQLIVAYTDKNKTPKYINLDNASDAQLSTLDLNLLANRPDILGTTVESGGSFKTGVYFASVQLKEPNGGSTNWSGLSNPIYVTDNGKADGESSGGPSDVISTKAIRLALTNLDTAFNKLDIALISKINGVVEAKVYKSISFSSTSTNLVITGGELTTPIALETILTQNQVYTKVGEIEALADQLFLADVEVSPVVDYQDLANNLRIQWTSQLVDSPAQGDDDVSTLYVPRDGSVKTFLHDEVYAFYAQIEPVDGPLTEWFHIPGEVAFGNPTDAASSTLANSVKIGEANPKRFHLEHMKGRATEGTASGGIIYGAMGYWENANEVYPANFPTYAGQKVRHHKFPSLKYMKDTYYTDASFEGARYLGQYWDVLGIRVGFADGSTYLKYKDKIKSIRIGYAKRDISNITVLGYDIVQISGYSDNSPGYTGTGGNWGITADGSNNEFHINSEKRNLRLHCPDLMILRPSVNDVYMSQIIKMAKTNLNDDFGIAFGGRYFSGTNTNPDIDVYTFISDFTYVPTYSAVSTTQRYIKLNNGRYVPSNSSLDISGIHINNLLNEEFIFFRAEKTVDITISANDLQVNLGDYCDSPGLTEQVSLVAIKSPKADMFVNYQDQQVIPIEGSLRGFDVSAFTYLKDGDGFICLHSFITMASAPNDNVPYNFDPADGIRCVKRFMCESHFNLNQRYQDSVSSYFFPQAFANSAQDYDSFKNSWLAQINQTSFSLNEIRYSKDFNGLNDLEQYGVYDHAKTYNSQLPFAIARSLKSRRDNDIDDGWRQFKPNDIFYTVKNKGRIINLQAWGSDNLLIHHEYALLKTRDKAVLETDITTISLGSGDLFTLEPKEMAPTKDGYGGTQHKFSCHLSEAGYAFVDAQTGEVFLHKGDDTFENISKGFRLFFQEVFKANPVKDNPLNDSGICLAFDKENYQLVLSLKAVINEGIRANSFTATYDLIKQEWVGLHDYLPDIIFNTRRNLYSFKDLSLYQHNVGPRGSFYGITYPSFTDVVINDEPSVEKILHAIQWITRVEKDGNIKPDETITSITVWNDYFCTGKIEVAPRVNLADYENKNAKQTDRTWNFDQIYDVVKVPGEKFIGGIDSDYRPITSNLSTELAWFEKEPLRGKYFIIRLEYSNFEDKLVSLRGVIPELKKSYQ